MWSEASIASHLSRIVFKRRCILLVDRCNWTGHEADVLGVTMDGRLIDVEIKISRSDLKADADKDKWWRRMYGAWNPAEHRHSVTSTHREWPPKVWKHYYVMPAAIWKPELADSLGSERSGVIVIHDAKHPGWPPQHAVVRRAQPCRDAYRLTPAQILDVARLANLRMWDARLRAEQQTAEVA